MLIVVRCALFVDCRSLYVDRCLLFVVAVRVRCLSFVVCWYVLYVVACCLFVFGFSCALLVMCCVLLFVVW